MTMTVRALMLLLAVAVGGCSSSAPPAESTAPRKLRFAVIPKALDIPVFNYARMGAEKAAAEFGDVEVLWNAPASADQLKQKEILESYITQRVDGIAISALNGDFLAETINRAVDAGIPVMGHLGFTPQSVNALGGNRVQGRGDAGEQQDEDDDSGGAGHDPPRCAAGASRRR